MPKPIEGVPVYGWEGVLRLAGLASAKMLRHDRKRPADAQKPVGQYWTGYEYHALFKLDEAVDLPPMSPGRQRLYDGNRTCARCGARSKEPWEKGRDGKRYCSPCQEPAAKDLWDREQAERRKASAEWAREVLADESVVLVAARSRQYWREIRVEGLTGAVLLDVKVRHNSDSRVDTRALERVLAEAPDSCSPVDIVDQVRRLVEGRRLVGWDSGRDLADLAWHFTPDVLGREIELPPLHTAAGDQFGKRYSNWVGQLAGGSYRWHPSVAWQPAPWEPDEMVAEMRTRLAAMAADRPAGEASDG